MKRIRKHIISTCGSKGSWNRRSLYSARYQYVQLVLLDLSAYRISELMMYTIFTRSKSNPTLSWSTRESQVRRMKKKCNLR